MISVLSHLGQEGTEKRQEKIINFKGASLTE